MMVISLDFILTLLDGIKEGDNKITIFGILMDD